MTTSFRKTALSRLVGQFHDKEKVKGLVESMVTPLEELSDDLNAIKHQRWVDTAEGEQLDGCGYIVGVSRQSRGTKSTALPSSRAFSAIVLAVDLRI